MRRSICGRAKGDKEVSSGQCSVSREGEDEEAAVSSTIHNPFFSAFLCDLGGFAVNPIKKPAPFVGTPVFECFAMGADYSAVPAVSASAAA
jgi:hypothetical protein